MSAPLTLSAEFRKLVEAQMDKVLKGVELTFNEIIEKQNITPTELKDELESLQESFNFLFQKWSLEILYTLLLKDIIGFGGIVVGGMEQAMASRLVAEAHGCGNCCGEQAELETEQELLGHTGEIKLALSSSSNLFSAERIKSRRKHFSVCEQNPCL